MCEIATEDGYVYCKIQKGMYGLPQAGIIVQDLFQARLAKVGYHQSKIIPGLWTHKTRKKCFTLFVDDFAIKYTSMEDAQPLIDALKQDDTITINWDATKYIVLGRQANLKESSKSKELAKLRLQVLVVVKANDACESKKEIMRLRE